MIKLTIKALYLAIFHPRQFMHLFDAMSEALKETTLLADF